MSLLSKLANAAKDAVCSKVIARLKENCPEELREPFLAFVGDEATVRCVRDFIGRNLKTPQAVTPEAIEALDLPALGRRILQTTPAIAVYLAEQAQSIMNK